MIKDNYTDIHSHILFGVDDGARDIDESLKMVEIAMAEGIRTIIATPHYGIENGHAPEMAVIQDNFHELCGKASAHFPELRLLLGSELYCAPDEVLQRVEDREALSMNNTKYLLLEFLEWGDNQESAEHITSTMLEIARSEWIPILAHAQRYKNFMGKQELYRDMVVGGVYLQINAYDLADRPDDWTRDNTRWLVDQQLAHFIGTDAHRFDRRQPVMRSGVDYLYSHCAEEYVDALIFGNAEKLIRGERL